MWHVFLLLFALFVANQTDACVNDADVGPIYVAAGSTQQYYLALSQNITMFEATGVDQMTSMPSNFIVSMNDKFGVFFHEESVDGCVRIEKNYTDLVSPVSIYFNCTNSLLGCYFSFNVDYEDCIGVCQGEFCQYDGCGRLCNFCFYPCDGDYCLTEPLPSFSMSQSSNIDEEIEESSSQSPVTQNQEKGDPETGLSQSETAGVVFGVLMVSAGIACIFLFYRSPNMFRNLLGKK